MGGCIHWAVQLVDTATGTAGRPENSFAQGSGIKGCLKYFLSLQLALYFEIIVYF